MGRRIQLDWAYMDKVAVGSGVEANAPGRILRCKPKSTKPPGGHTLWLGDLSIDCVEQDIIDFFEPCGKVDMICMKVNQLRNGHFGHVKFFDTDAVDKAVELAGTSLKGVPVRMDYAEDKPQEAYRSGKDRVQPETQARPPDCQTVWIGGLPADVTEEMIREFFDKCGVIQEIRLDSSKRSGAQFCHVEFGDGFAVDRAVKLSGESVGGSRIRIDFAENRKRDGFPGRPGMPPGMPGMPGMPPGMLPGMGPPPMMPPPHMMGPYGMYPPPGMCPPPGMGPPRPGGPPPPGMEGPPGPDGAPALADGQLPPGMAPPRPPGPPGPDGQPPHGPPPGFPGWPPPWGMPPGPPGPGGYPPFPPWGGPPPGYPGGPPPGFPGGPPPGFPGGPPPGYDWRPPGAPPATWQAPGAAPPGAPPAPGAAPKRARSGSYSGSSYSYSYTPSPSRSPKR